MRACKAIAIAAAGLFVSAAAARGADMPGSWLPDMISKQTYTDLISGWYVRGDLGWRMQSFDSVEPAVFPLSSWSIGNAFTFGGGGGYKHKWLRIDATLDYAAPARFTGDVAGFPGYYSTKVDAFTLLANVYLDLGEWGGFTPYVGAGVGTSNVRTHEFVTGLLVAPPQGIKDTSRWNMSWAWMAGFSYRFSPSLLLDVSYRQLYIGDAMSGPEPFNPPVSNYLRDLTAKEIRVGLRWMLD